MNNNREMEEGKHDQRFTPNQRSYIAQNSKTWNN